MHTLYLMSVWLHILAAVIWLGGMLFLVLVLVPWIRSGGRAQAVALLREGGRRFRTVGWACFAVLALTGAFNLGVRGVSFGDLARAEWHSSTFGRLVMAKLGLFVLVLVVSAFHDFWLGPRAAQVMEAAPRSAAAETLRRRASLLGRANVLFALVLVALGVMLVRGVP